MSAVVANLGPVFVTETGRRSASVGGAYLTETTVNYVDLAGGLTPSLSFAGDLTVAVGGGPWTPTLVPGLEIWLDAAQLALADGASISTWTNLGSGSSLTIAAPPLTFKAGIVNGHGAVRFSGSSGSAYVRGVTTVTKDFTVAYVARRWGPIVGRIFMGPTPPVNVAIGSHGVGRYSCYDGGWLTFGTPWEDAASIPPQFDLFSYDSAAVSGSRFFVYGDEKASNPSNEGLGNTWGISGYEATSPSELMDCDVGEVLLYDHQLTDADRQSCEGYLAWKWGVEAFLPVDHPYKSAPPGGSAALVDLAGDLSPSIVFAADVSDVFTLAGDLAVTVNFAADVADLFSLTGDLAPSVAFGANLSVNLSFAGGLSPSVTFAADLTVTAAPANYVDLSGNLGGVSSYGRGKYGAGKYSRNGAITPIFAGDIQILGEVLIVGDLAPVVTFHGDLSFAAELVGDLAPQVTFAADLSLVIGLAGDLAPQIDLGATLTGLVSLAGDLPVRIDFAASSLFSGPLWEGTEPCPLPPWAETDPCPPPVWASSEPCPPPHGWTNEPASSMWTPTDSSIRSSGKTQRCVMDE